MPLPYTWDDIGALGGGSTLRGFMQQTLGETGEFTPLGPRPWLDVRAYGAKCDSVTDDTAAIQAAINAAIFNGGGIVYLPNVNGNWYVLNGTLTITDAEGVRLLGDGANHSVYQGTTPSGTQIRRLSGTGAMLDWKAVTAAQALRGCGIKGISFDGQNLASTGVKLTSIYGGLFEDVHIRECTSVALDMTTVDLSGVEDCQINTFDLVTIRQVNAATGIGLRMGSGTPGIGNSSGNVFKQLLIFHKNGVGMQLNDADSNRFYGCTVNRGGGDTGVGLELNASNHASSGHARSNAFYHAEFTGGITARATGFSLPSANNFVYLSTESSSPTITRETGATLYINTVQGGKTAMVQDGRYRMVFQDDFPLVQNASGNIGQLRWTLGGTATDRNSEANHPGIERLDTTASAGTLAGIYTPNSSSQGLLLPADMFDLTMILRLNNNDTDTMMRVGLAMSPSVDPPTDGIYFEKLFADTNWNIVTRSGGVQSRSANAAITTNFVRLRIRRINPTTVGFSVDGGAEAPSTTNVPTVTLGLSLLIKNQTAVSKTFDVDFVQLAALLTR